MHMRARTWIIIGAVAVAAGMAYGLKEFNRGLAEVEAMDAVESVDASALLAAFVADDQAARAKYVGATEQAIRVLGVISAIEPGTDSAPTNVRLDAGDPMASVVCEFAADQLPAEWKVGDQVALKGICQGYTGEGMMPGDVILQRCVAAEQ